MKSLVKFGVEVPSDIWERMWNKVIKEAQKVKTISLNGKRYRRVRYGKEGKDWWMGIKPPERCHDCGVRIGQYHVPGCDMEMCPHCGRQLISCNCRKSKRDKWSTFIVPQDLGFSVR